MQGKITTPDNVRPFRKYWLAHDGTAYQVDDHLLAAQYAKADSNEYEKPFPWSYEDMFRHGWVRVHTESTVIWADNTNKTMSTKQRQWLSDAAIYLETETGQKVRVSKGLDNKEQIISREDKEAMPTKTFLQTLKEITAKYIK